MHKQLTLEQRYYIYIAGKKGHSMRRIATELGVAHSTVGRELKRNTGKRGYRHRQANNLAQQRHAVKHKSIKMNQAVKRLIKNRLALDWSPEQICGWFRVHRIINLHHESVYRYLLKDKAEGGMLYKPLRHQGKPYRKRYGYANNRTGIPDRVDIEKRPEAVNNREVFGHWEADTIIGKAHQGAIVTTDERISKVRLAYPVNTAPSDKVSVAMCALLEPVSKAVHSITYDNGKEFAGHQQVNQSIQCQSYFAKPYHSMYCLNGLEPRKIWIDEDIV